METKETLTDFIARRTRELDEEESGLRKRLELIALEREHLHNAEKVSFGIKTPESEVIRAIRKRRIGIKPGTIMDSVINILKDHKDGLPAQRILRYLNVDKEEGWLKRESLSPQLSRLRQAGFIELDGSIWKLSHDREINEKETK
jgi:hypothetical protein